MSAAAIIQPRYILPALLFTAVASAPLLIYRRRQAAEAPADADDSSSNNNNNNNTETTDPEATDPPLLRKHSEIKPYSTSRFTYPGIRVFYRRHPKADELPATPSPIPLLVFIHGLGGSAAQFNSLLTSLVHVASCLAIDLPGCGLSRFAPEDWDAYATDALVELLEVIIDDYREKAPGQHVVLIGHSMGSALSARLASRSVVRPTALSRHVVGLVAICPPSDPPTEKQVSKARIFLSIPTPLFDLFRYWDRRGGLESPSVHRFVGADATADVKRLQYRFNCQSRTPVWRRMAWGFLPDYTKPPPRTGFATRDVWRGINVPVFLIAGQDDRATTPESAEKIREWLSEKEEEPDTTTTTTTAATTATTTTITTTITDDSPLDAVDVAPASTDVPPARPGPDRARGTTTTTTTTLLGGKARIEDLTEEDFHRRRRSALSIEDPHEDPSTPREGPPEMPAPPSRPRRSVDLVVLPSPATHALLYTPSTARVLAGLVSDFLSTSVSGRLSLGWQLRYLSKEGKWDVKNLAKWKQVEPVSEPVAGIFRAMKTLREVDDQHSPRAFVARWGRSVSDIIDISHDTPVYDPAGLEAGGISYHKLPSVSKIPPSRDEVNAFIALVDKLFSQHVSDGRARPEGAVAVHCHYGFNRTGFFIVCYLIERCHFDVQAAIDEFARARPKGIRHQHFLDQLFVRYSSLNSTSRPEE